MNISYKNILFLIFFLCSIRAFASGPNFNDTTQLAVSSSPSGNVGIGTTLSANKLDVQGSVGIGTAYAGYSSAPANGMIVQGNVGIGSITPGQNLDVQGTIRMTGFNFAAGAGAGKALTSDANGNGTWAAVTATAGGSTPQLQYNNAGSLGAVTSGGTDGTNIGIGTVAFNNRLNIVGNVGISTLANSPYVTNTLASPGAMVVEGNVGIGTWLPGNSLEVKGGNIGINKAHSLIGIGTTSTILTLQNDTSSIYVGWQAGASAAAGVNGNAAVGGSALQLTTTGGANAALGYLALQNNTTGSSNAAVGDNVLSANTTGASNSAMGRSALSSNTTGSDNSTVGYQALSSNTTGSFNTAMGDSSLINSQTGYNNTALGYQAGVPNGNNGTINGSNNVFLGANSGPIGTGDYSNSVGIGSFAVAGANNVMVLGGTGSNALNVGIGTFSPVSTLAVSGNAAIGSGGAYTTISGPSNGLIVQGNIGIATFQANNSLIVASGNVGLGSLAPGQVLDVQGTIRMTGFNFAAGAGAGKALTSDANGNGTWAAVTATAGGSTPQLQYNNAGSLGAVTSGGTDGTNIGIGTVAFNNRLNIVGNVGISTLANSPYVTNTLASPGAMVVEGNVGIGTWTPTATLNVIGNVGLGTWVNANQLDVFGGTALGTYAGQRTAPSNGLIVSGNVGIGSLDPIGTFQAGGGLLSGQFIPALLVSNNNVGIGSNAPGAVFDVYRAGTGKELMRITSTGNVGLGSAAPGAGLDVNPGPIRITGGSSTVIEIIFGTDNKAAIESTALTAGDMKFLTNNAEVMRITNGGNVGIGTTVPIGKLNVIGNVGLGTWVNANQLDVFGGTALGTYAGQNAAPSNGLIISGNVGIGSTAPQSLLTIGGGGHVGSSGTAPTVASNDCGSTVQGTITAGSTDIRGEVTVGTVTVTSCAVTFNTAFGRAPYCVTQDDTTVLGDKATTSTTKLTITAASAMDSDKIRWICIE